MSLSFTSTSTAAGLEQLNNYFAGNTYVFGTALTASDATLFTVRLRPVFCLVACVVACFFVRAFVVRRVVFFLRSNS